MARVSVIIANYNGLHFLKDCLHSLSIQTYRDFEVIAVDNGSGDGSADWLNASPYPFVKPVLLTENFGFGIANNRGYDVATGEIIVILNNDTILPENFLKKLIAPLANANVDMVAPLIVYKDRADIVDKAGGHLFYPDGLNRGRGCGEKLIPRYLKAGECFYPDGCAAAFRRELIEKAGFFDEDFFLYGEDTDLGLRYRRAGATCFYQPEAVVNHIHSGTAGKYSPDKAYYVERNRWYVLMKNLPWFWIFLSPFFTLIRYFFQAIAALVGKGSPGHFAEGHSRMELLKTLYRANRDGIKAIPALLKKRKQLSPLFTIGGFAFSGLIIRYFLSPVKIAFRD
ncbi:MAG: glycosyltransferase family 2 protein [Acidobacteria bacterium]|nr:glycosyltransferase family 2 protein [Acidobacteriota bacterium]